MTLKIHEAIIYAGKRHAGQVRKGTSLPYLVHPMEVMGILIENNCSENVIIAGVLHDIIEDTCEDNDVIRDIVRKEIKSIFGQEVLELVDSASEDKTKTWKERKQATINNLAHDSKEAQEVCCADKLSNILSIYADKQKMGDKIFNRFNAPKEELKWYYEGIATTLTKLSGSQMLSQLKEYIEIVFAL